MIPRAQNNYKKMIEFWRKEMDRVREINKPTQTELNYNEARIQKLENDIKEIHHYKRTSLVEDFAELIKLKDKEFTQFEIDRELGQANPDHISEGGKMKVSPFKGLLNWARRSQDKAPPSSPSTKPKKKRGWFRRITGR